MPTYCELCNTKSNIIYTTRKYGFICNNCMCKINNSKEEKKERELEKLLMFQKYGVV